jgi:hypothetical protein
VLREHCLLNLWLAMTVYRAPSESFRNCFTDFNSSLKGLVTWVTDFERASQLRRWWLLVLLRWR